MRVSRPLLVLLLFDGPVPTPVRSCPLFSALLRYLPSLAHARCPSDVGALALRQEAPCSIRHHRLVTRGV